MTNALRTTDEPAWKNLTGVLPFSMTNDFLFKILLQNNNDVLKAIICAYLDMEPEEIRQIRITNTISLKADITSKEMILDVRAELNDDSVVNLEMQVLNNHDWPERSLAYLCRCFDNLQKGQPYIYVKGAVHISFLDYTMFPKRPEFYATYLMKNERTGQIYSSKFRISVVDLTHIELATEKDKMRHRDLWAAFFKAKGWEELKMLAQKDRNIEQAVTTIHELTEDEEFRQRCEAREDFLRQQMDYNYWVAGEFTRYQKEAAELRKAVRDQKASLAEKENTIAEQSAIIEALKQKLENSMDGGQE
jgi:predicted transposase/invertase (TIGR01784 family)